MITKSVVVLHYLNFRCKYLYVKRYKILYLSAYPLSSVNCNSPERQNAEMQRMQEPSKCATDTYVVNIKVAHKKLMSKGVFLIEHGIEHC